MITSMKGKLRSIVLPSEREVRLVSMWRRQKETPKAPVSVKWQPDWPRGSSHSTARANKGGPFRHWLCSPPSGGPIVHPCHSRGNRGWGGGGSSEWCAPAPGVMGGWEPLRVSGQKRNQARLRETHREISDSSHSCQ